MPISESSAESAFSGGTCLTKQEKDRLASQMKTTGEDFWLKLHAATASRVGQTGASKVVPAFKEAHRKRISSLNLEQAEELCRQVFNALSASADS